MALVTVQRSPTPSTTSSPCVSESGSGEDDRRSQPRSISESFLTVKGAALFLPRGNSPTPNSSPQLSQRRNKHTGDLQKHLQTMFTVLRPEDTIRLAVRLESVYPQVTRYMVVVSTNGRQDTEESIVLGMDFVSSDSCCSVGLVLPLWSNTLIHLDGDGGFSVSTVNRVHVFKPVSVQAMWSALQSLHKACEVARCHNYYPGSLFLTWVSYYQSRISSNQFCINEWNAMQDVESHRANSPVLFTDLPTERERTERLIRMRLKEIMMQKDLENVTCKEIRTELEMQMVCNLREFKEFIDNEMIVILGQMDSPTEIFEHVYLGSEWNASNLEELQTSGVHYILNVTREIDNFFPGMFEYHNIRVYDEEATNLLEYWNETFKFISKAKKAGTKCLVHCKMGVSRSASTVIAYAMKEYGWDLDTAFDYVKERRAVTKPNPSFMKQLEEYQGILLASKQRHNKLWRSHSDSDLSDRPECKTSSDSHNNNTSSPSLHHILGVAVLQALAAEPVSTDTHSSDSHNGVCDSPGEEDPLPRPRAATIVPEDRPDNPVSVAFAVAAALPHPPPSLLILPPTPELQRAHRGPATPGPPELCLSFPERSSSEDISPLTLQSADSIDRSLSDTTSDIQSPLSPAHIPPGLPLDASDDNNNPSEFVTDSRGDADGSSNHSADSINFLSAREKFLGLAQDGGSRTPQTTPLSLGEDEDTEEEEENGTSQSDDSTDKSSPDRTNHHDNAVSVRHIVTEIEAICHSPSSSSLPPSSHSPQLVRTERQTEADPSEVSLTLPPHPQSPSTLPRDWPAGSVRRATKQLELKLKQEMESQRSPLHSPCAEHAPVRLSPSLNAEPPPLRLPQDTTELRRTQVEIPPLPAQSKDTELTSDSDRPVSGALPTTDSHTLTSSLDTSAQPHSHDQQRSNQVTLDGVTVHESNTEERPESSSQEGRGGGCGPDCNAQSKLARGSHELERIQQTLRELQAFLQDGTGLETNDSQDLELRRGLRDVMDTEPSSGPTPLGLRLREGKSFLETAGWFRTMELEARIRQAGLTPPSLMKRSASLAKLDCLELSANDLSDLDLRPRTAASSFPTSQPDDSWKKQKVLAGNTKTDLPDGGGDLNESLCFSSAPHLRDEEREEPDGSGAIATARQQGRGHPLRRSRKAEKKQRSVAALYNTM